MRTFLAIEVPQHLRKKVDSRIQEEKAKSLPIRWVAFQNLHITLKFLGEIDDKKKDEIIPVITEIGKRYTPFTVRLEGMGCFPNQKNPRVLWIGVAEGAEALSEIAHELEEKLSQIGFKKEKRFHAHLTIGRIKQPCNIDDILHRNITTESFPVKAITLFKSNLRPDGPVYEELKKFTFG